MAAGRSLSEGPARSLSASPDGSRLAWLSDCAASPGGKGLVACALRVAPTAGGAGQRVAEGLTAADGGFSWGPDGSLAAIARRDAATGEGELVVLRPGRDPAVLASRASTFAWGPESRIAFVAAGALHLATPDGRSAPLRGGAGAGAFAFAPGAGRAIAAVVRGPGGVPELAVWREAGAAPDLVARDVAAFAFSPDGEMLAAIAGEAPGVAGSLVAVPLAPAGARALPPVAVARSVGEFRWAQSARRLAWLTDYDARIRAGTLATALPGGEAVSLAPRVTSFELSPAGDRLAYVRHVTDGGYAARLELSPAQLAAPGTVAGDAASFEFSADGRWLYVRAGCTSGTESCVLSRASAAGPSAGQAPERIAEGVAGFVLDRWRPDRALVSFVRRDGAGVDLALWSEGRLTTLDAGALAGSARFLPPDGRRVAWIASRANQAGVRVADAP
jgi:dipeptidyl aminopeptidase/acylaminoacyl peptidase